ncbi:hypothetical protein DL96DRAFT_1708397 [Flagelloscypha sp. PMI_526]|nr:hypothetical protein DL96DRAFT_1708397 [Flagelloscypha sp. PMI_526]
MRSLATIILSALLAFLVSAMPAVDTNAQRMARGLPPMAPRNFYKASPIAMARRGSPSSQPGQCNGGEVQCCNTVTDSNDKVASLLAGLLDIALPANVPIGLSCSPLNIVGIGGNSVRSLSIPRVLSTLIPHTSVRLKLSAAKTISTTVSSTSVVLQASQSYPIRLTS